MPFNRNDSMTERLRNSITKRKKTPQKVPTITTTTKKASNDEYDDDNGDTVFQRNSHQRNNTELWRHFFRRLFFV